MSTTLTISPDVVRNAARVILGRSIDPAPQTPVIKFTETLALYRFGAEDDLHLLVGGDGNYKAIANAGARNEVRLADGNVFHHLTGEIATLAS